MGYICKNENQKNKFEYFTIINEVICSWMDQSKCLDGNYNFMLIKLEYLKFEHLTCSSIFAKLGYKWCFNQKTLEVEYVDESDNWDIENVKLYGIGYERCLLGALDDPCPCCSSVNPEVVSTNENDSWGFKDGQWYGIGEG